MKRLRVVVSLITQDNDYQVEQAAAAEEASKTNSLVNDPWYGPTSRLKGRVDWDGRRYITSQQCLDALEVPMHARNGAVFRRLTKMMRTAWVGTDPHQVERH